VRMGEDEDIDPAIPRRESLVEVDEEPIGVGPAVHDHPAAGAAFDEDGITLADVEDNHARDPVWSVAGGEQQGEARARERQSGQAR